MKALLLLSALATPSFADGGLDFAFNRCLDPLFSGAPIITAGLQEFEMPPGPEDELGGVIYVDLAQTTGLFEIVSFDHPGCGVSGQTELSRDDFLAAVLPRLASAGIDIPEHCLFEDDGETGGIAFSAEPVTGDLYAMVQLGYYSDNNVGEFVVTAMLQGDNAQAEIFCRPIVPEGGDRPRSAFEGNN